MKTVDTKSYLDALCEIAAQGNCVTTVVAGASMTPFLSGGRDYVYLEAPSQKLKKGDIVLFVRDDGRYILHRIRYIRKDGYYMVGDRQTVTEGPVQKEQIKALVTGAKRKGKELSPKSPLWLFFSKVWIRMVPLRPTILSLLYPSNKSK